MEQENINKIYSNANSNHKNNSDNKKYNNNNTSDFGSDQKRREL